MPIKKTNKKTFRKPNTLNKRVKALESNMKAEETKRHVTPYGEAVITANTSSSGGTLQMFTLLNDMNQGDGANSIDGVEYSLTGIKTKWFVHNSTGVENLFRIAVIRTKNLTITANGQDLFLDAVSNGLDFADASESQKLYLPLNHKKYDIIFEDMIKLGKSTGSSTSRFNTMAFINNYRRYANRKESIDGATNPNTRYYLVAWVVDGALDLQATNVELSGHATFYYKDN